MRLGDLAVFVLQQIGLVAVQNARAPTRQRCRVFLVQPMPRCLDAQHPHGGIIKEGVEQADGVAAPADGRDQQIGQAANAAQHLFAGLAPDYALEIADQFGIGMRAGGGADDVECVMDIRHPVAQRLVHRVLQRGGAAGDGHHLGAQQLHAEHIGRLTGDVGCPHIYHARQAKTRANRGGGDAVLAGAGLRDDPRFAHAHRQQNLADAIVDLVRAGVVQLVALEPDLRAAQFLGQARREIQRAGAAHVMFQQIVELLPKGGVLLGAAVFRLQIEYQRHQRFGDIAPAECAEMAVAVGLLAQGVCGHGHDNAIGRGAPRCLGAARRARHGKMRK